MLTVEEEKTKAILEMKQENEALKKTLLAYFMYVQSNRNPCYLKDVDEGKVKKLLGVENLM